MARQTNRELVAELRRVANMERFETCQFGPAPAPVSGDEIREMTRIYRASWLAPLLDEIERRLVRK